MFYHLKLMQMLLPLSMQGRQYIPLTSSSFTPEFEALDSRIKPERQAKVLITCALRLCEEVPAKTEKP